MNRHEQYMARIALQLLVTCRTCGMGKPHSEMAVISRRQTECKSCRVGPRPCVKCGELKTCDEFYAQGRRQRASYCKTCELARQSERKAATPPAQWMFDRVRHRAKAEGKEFSIAIADIFIPTHCPVLGIKLAAVGAAAQTYATPTLDRVDSVKGYVPGNVAVISARANKMKGEGTAKEHERIAAWMRSKGAP